MTGVSINGIPVSFPATSFQYNSTSVSGGTIFDSGTTYTELTDDVFAAVVLVISYFPIAVFYFPIAVFSFPIEYW